MIRRFLPPSLAALMLGTSASAAEVQAPGPDGPLSAMATPVAGAAHVVVLIPGSGPTDRDGNGPLIRSDSYRLLAEALADAGIASLRIDKRGMFASHAAIADPNAVTLAAYAADARAWVAKARALAPCVWLMGHSEGGLVALLAAADPPPGLCGLILLATPGRPVGQLMIEQMQANPAAFLLMDDLRRIVADLEQGRSRDPASLPALLRPLFPAAVQPYLIDVFSYDPATLAAGWTGPALIVQGGADVQVTPADAAILAAAMPQATRIDLPEATHMLKPDIPGHPMATYGNPSLPLDPGLIPAITAFLAAAKTP
jgi:hypothetical protein